MDNMTHAQRRLTTGYAMASREALTRFLSDREASGCSRKTLFTYEYWLTRYIEYLAGAGKTVPTATDNDVRQFAVEVVNPRYARSTARLILSAIKTFYRWLYDGEFVPHNPARNFRLPRPTNKLRPVMKAAQVNQLVNCFNLSRFFGNRNRALIILLLDTGLRVGEASKLTLADYDDRERMIQVKNTKNGEDRIVPVSQILADELDDYLTHWRMNIPGPYLFPRSTGARLKGNRIRGIFAECTKLLGWRIHPHACRRTFATTMLQNGASLEAVRRILGHKSLASTSVYLQTDMAYLVNQHDKYTPTNNLRSL